MRKYRVEMNVPNGGQVNFVTEAEDSFRALTWATAKMIQDGMEIMTILGLPPTSVIEGTLIDALNGVLSVDVYEVYTDWGGIDQEDKLYAY